ncbi:MAG: hypothetical protein KJ690_04565 [Alphaproteobacteria bacterium]|nr:hypothetical protein [Rhizobiaceae bacterium]MBU4135670.1 hypothetical protein [Alphaproteobacteria bacterium]
MVRFAKLAALVFGACLIWAGAASAQPATAQSIVSSSMTVLQSDLIGGTYRPRVDGVQMAETARIIGISRNSACDVRMSFAMPGYTYQGQFVPARTVTWDSSIFSTVAGASASGAQVTMRRTSGASTIITTANAAAAQRVADALMVLVRDCQGLPQPTVATPPRPRTLYYYAEATVMCVDFPGGQQNGLAVACGNSGNGLGGYRSDAAFLATRPDCMARNLGVFNVERSGARYYGCGFGYGAANSPEDARKSYPNFIPNRTIFACDVVQSRCDRRP